MARPTKVSYYLKGKTFYVRFQKNGQRIKKSCKTGNEDQAKSIAKQIEILLFNPDFKPDSKVHEIFFGELPDIYTKDIEKEFEAFEDEESLEYVIAHQAKELAALRREVSELKDYKKKYEALLNKEEYRRIDALDSMPTCSKSLEQYSSVVSHLNDKGRLHVRLLSKLFDFLNSHSQKISNIKTRDIYKFLEENSLGMLKEDGTREDVKDIAERWNRRRTMLHRFWKWLSVTHDCENIILKIETKKKMPKTGIHWHSVEDLEKELSDKDIYWKAIIAIMGFAGLSAHEIRGMRKEDYDGEFLTIQAYEDRRTKSENRIRRVAVNKKRLKPILDEYLLSKKESPYLFPSTVGGFKMWTTVNFSRHLTRNIETEGMNALSLRRTFGSLLLRSGKNESDVAAAMGNTTVMVRKHYAKLLGCEVDIDF